MLLSHGEEHQEMLRAEYCLEGEAKYDVNILTVCGFFTISSKLTHNSYGNIKASHAWHIKESNSIEEGLHVVMTKLACTVYVMIVESRCL